MLSPEAAQDNDVETGNDSDEDKEAYPLNIFQLNVSDEVS